MRINRLLWVAVVVVAVLCPFAVAAEINAIATNPSGVYKTGEPITIRVEVTGDDSATIGPIKYEVRLGGKQVIGSGTVELTDKIGTIETSLKEPGTVLVVFTAKQNDKEVKALAGAAVEPEKIKVSAPRPDDFDAFWAEKLKELAAVPMNAKVEPAPAPEDEEKAITYSKVTLDNIRGTHIYGQLARPSKPGKYPAILLVQYAGVYPLHRTWVTDRAAQGWLAFNIIAHDVPFDLPASEFEKLAQTTLKGYTAIGEEDRETSYFLRMCLGASRAVDYLASRDDWDGKILVVSGTSQGGYQSIVAAGLNPKVTHVVVNVPAGCDTTANLANRAFGWPYWQAHAKGDKAEKIMTTSRYFDAVNFASRIKVPTLVALGLIDQTCPTSSVYAMANQLGGEKEIVVMPRSEHRESNSSQAPFHKRSAGWLNAIKAGKPVPATKPVK